MKLRKNLDDNCLFNIESMSILLNFKENVYMTEKS